MVIDVLIIVISSRRFAGYSTSYKKWWV